MDNLQLKRISRRLKPEMVLWIKNDYPVPVPFQIKFHTLLRHAIPNSDWIETGTYLAETTVSLSKKFPNNKIYTIEPAKRIHNYVSKLFSSHENIEFIYGTSEDVFGETIAKVQKRVNFWLDGHYSGDITFQGPIDSPVIRELEIIEGKLANFDEVRIFVDDFRLFGCADGYPSREFLVEAAHKLDGTWSVENDIFIISANPMQAL